MTLRRVAGHSRTVPGRTQLAAALARADLTEQAWRNFIVLRRFSGDAWTDRYRERPHRTPLIPSQRPAREGARKYAT